MSNVKKPEPVAWVRKHPDGALTNQFLEDGVIEEARKQSGAWMPLITAGQSEAYKDACVREALEEAASILNRMYVNALKAKVPTDEDDEAWNLICTAQARSLTEALLEVKALIPKQ